MAMTKKERAEFDAAIQRAETLAALRWTGPVSRDVPIPESGYSQGWDYNEHSTRVWLAWSSLASHGDGEAPKQYDAYRSASQNGRSLFSTRARALAALRHAIESTTATRLLNIDRQITIENKEQE